MRLSQNHEEKFQHFLHEFRFLQLVLLDQLLADGVFDFFEYLGTKDQLQGGVDDRIHVVGVFLSTAVVEEDVDDLEAEELEVVQTFGGDLLFILFADEPVDQGDQVVEPVGKYQVIPVDT